MTSNDKDLTQLIADLEQLPDYVDFPATPDIADEVKAEIAPPHRGALLLPIGLVAAALVLLLLGTPQARSAMLDALSVVGIEIRTAESPRSGEELPLLDESLFGTQVTIDRAREAFHGELVFPTTLLPSTPDAVYLMTNDTGLVSVTFVYPASDTLPAIGDSELGAILTQVSGPADVPYLYKTTFETGPDVFVSDTNMQMQWIDQGESAIAEEPESRRSSANVLIWLDGAHGFRLESGLSQEQSILVAESMTRGESGNRSARPFVRGVSTRSIS